jgi:hypothetical protein
VASRLDAQREDLAAEAVTRPALFRINQAAKRIGVSRIFDWRLNDLAVRRSELDEMKN